MRLGPRLALTIAICFLMAWKVCYAGESKASGTLVITSPLAEVYDTSAPSVSWICADDSDAARVILRRDDGAEIMNTAFRGFSQPSSRNCVGPNLGEEIIPPLEMTIKPQSNCPAVGPCQVGITPAKYWGLSVGGYTLELQVRQKKTGNILSSSRHFNIEDTLHTDFLSGSAGWAPLRLRWSRGPEGYTSSGDTAGAIAISGYTFPKNTASTPHQLRGLKEIDIKFSLACASHSRQCYGGVMFPIAPTPHEGGIAKYTGLEFILTGDGRFQFRSYGDGQTFQPLVDVDVSQHLKAKSVDLRLYYSGECLVVRLNGDLITSPGKFSALWLWGNSPSPTQGQLALIFSGTNSNDIFDVSNIIVRPLRTTYCIGNRYPE